MRHQFIKDWIDETTVGTGKSKRVTSRREYSAGRSYTLDSATYERAVKAKAVHPVDKPPKASASGPSAREVKAAKARDAAVERAEAAESALADLKGDADALVAAFNAAQDDDAAAVSDLKGILAALEAAPDGDG